MGVQEEVPVASFRGWHPAVTEMIKAASSPIRWGLFTVRPLLRWYRGRVVILGRRRARDAAAPRAGREHLRSRMRSRSPALLAEAEAGRPGTGVRPVPGDAPRPHPEDPAQLLVTSALLHLPDGPGVLARDAKVATVPEDFGWIHEYDVQQALRAAGAAPAGAAARA